MRSSGDIEGKQPFVFRWLKTVVAVEEPLSSTVRPGFPDYSKRYLVRTITKFAGFLPPTSVYPTLVLAMTTRSGSFGVAFT